MPLHSDAPAQVEHDHLAEDAQVVAQVLEVCSGAATEVDPDSALGRRHGLDHRHAAVQEAVPEHVVGARLPLVERLKTALVVGSPDRVEPVVEQHGQVVSDGPARLVLGARDDGEARVGDRREVRRVVHGDAVRKARERLLHIVCGWAR
jgi:hypothetical protein